MRRTPEPANKYYATYAEPSHEMLHSSRFSRRREYAHNYSCFMIQTLARTAPSASPAKPASLESVGVLGILG
jgi:hypothetical protein